MIKEFCDQCGKEITRNFVDERLTFRITEGNRFFGEVIMGRDMTWNAGAICFHCLKSLLYTALSEEEVENEHKG